MDNFSISFKVDGNDIIFENVDSPFDDLRLIPRVGDQVSFNYVHGLKLHFTVTSVTHFIYSSGHDIVQYVTIHGETN